MYAEIDLYGDLVCTYCNTTNIVEHPVIATIRFCITCEAEVTLTQSMADMSEQRFKQMYPQGRRDPGTFVEKPTTR